jgi:cell shape-determining protein MreD
MVRLQRFRTYWTEWLAFGLAVFLQAVTVIWLGAAVYSFATVPAYLQFPVLVSLLWIALMALLVAPLVYFSWQRITK